MSFPQGVNFEIGVECRIFVIVIFFNKAEFCNLGHLQGIKVISFELRHPYKCDLSDFDVG